METFEVRDLIEDHEKRRNREHYQKHKTYFLAYGNRLMKCDTCNKEVKRHNWNHHLNSKLHQKMVGVDDTTTKQLEETIRKKILAEIMASINQLS